MKTNPTPRIEPGLIALLAAVGLGVVALILSPRLFGEAAPSSPETIANRERIEGMTQAERDRIKRRQEKFGEMSESRRNEIRKLHADLQTATDAKELQTVMKRYNIWLTSLPVDERDKLRTKLKNAKTPSEQRKIVVETKQAKDDERLVQSAPPWDRAAYHHEKDPAKKEEILARIRETYAYGAQRSWGPRLNADELDAVVNVIAGQLQPTAAQRAEWAKLQPQPRRMRIMAAALKAHGERRRKREPGLLGNSDLRQPIEAGIKDASLRERLMKKPAVRRRWPWSNYSVVALVKNSIDHERRQECGNPTDEQLSQYFQTLSEKRKEDLSQQGPEKMKTLKRWYFFSGGENGEDYRTFVTEFYSTFRYPGSFGKPQRKSGDGGRRRGGGRNGERSRKPKGSRTKSK